MDTGHPRPPSLRERTREAVREQVRSAAIELFEADGFNATTTEGIARAVGISPRSFFRYFVTKEDVLVGGSVAFGAHVCTELEARPTDEPIWLSLRRALDPVAATESDTNLKIVSIIMSAGSLRAHNYEKHLAWEQMMVPIIDARLDGESNRTHARAETLAHVALACLDVAMAQWVHLEGARPLSVLLDESFATVADT